MTTLWFGNASRITDPLCGESIGHQWFAITKGQWYFFVINLKGLLKNSRAVGEVRPIRDTLRRRTVDYSIKTTPDAMTLMRLQSNDLLWLPVRSSNCYISLQWRHNGRDSVSNHQPRECLLSRLIRRRSKKISNLRVTGLCAGNAQSASNAENVSIWWRHHVFHACKSWQHIARGLHYISVTMTCLPFVHK